MSDMVVTPWAKNTSWILGLSKLWYLVPRSVVHTRSKRLWAEWSGNAVMLFEAGKFGTIAIIPFRAHHHDELLSQTEAFSWTSRNPVALSTPLHFAAALPSTAPHVSTLIFCINSVPIFVSLVEPVEPVELVGDGVSVSFGAGPGHSACHSALEGTWNGSGNLQI